MALRITAHLRLAPTPLRFILYLYIDHIHAHNTSDFHIMFDHKERYSLINSERPQYYANLYAVPVALDGVVIWCPQ